MGAITPTARLCGFGHYRKPQANSDNSGLPRFKTGAFTLPATADDTDYVYVDLWAQFGIQKLLGVTGFIHTTANSVIVQEAPTTEVTGNTLKLTVGGSTDNKKRFYVLYGL